jgi:hypothetical protein
MVKGRYIMPFLNSKNKKTKVRAKTNILET